MVFVITFFLNCPPLCTSSSLPVFSLLNFSHRLLLVVGHITAVINFPSQNNAATLYSCACLPKQLWEINRVEL